MDEYLSSRNMTKIFGLAGKLAYAVFSMNQTILNSQEKLGWTETDPLLADPLPSTTWVPVQSFYEFLDNSKFATSKSLDQAFASTENFLINYSQLSAYLAVNDTRNAIFSFCDMLLFTYNMTEGFHDSYFQTINTLSLIQAQGGFSSNLFSNFFGVSSDLMAMIAEIYYLDFINLFGVLGNLTYKLFVSSLIV